MRRRSSALLLLMGGVGCSSEPSHIPPLWQMPGAAMSTVFENAAYDARRDRVKRLVTLHERALILEIDRGAGPTLVEAMDTARVSAQKRGLLRAELRNNPAIYRYHDDRGRLDIEAVTVALMVYGE